ncbi:MAG: hypothetical protein HOK99_03740 [Betaproteobacteria bacterium]|nr:hypothetical protein [Betaproteobacteria bacterium]
MTLKTSRFKPWLAILFCGLVFAVSSAWAQSVAELTAAAEQGNATAQYNKHSNFDHSKSASVSSRLWSIGWSMSELETNSSLCVVKGFCMPYFYQIIGFGMSYAEVSYSKQLNQGGII